MAEAWNNHCEEDIDKVMRDYTEESIIRNYEHSEGVYKEIKGLTEIRDFYTYVLDKSSGCAESFTNPVDDHDENARNVYFISDCPEMGTWGANDNFLFSSDFKIIAQNVAWTESKNLEVAPYRLGKELDEIEIKRVTVPAASTSPVMQLGYMQESVAAAWDNHFVAFGAQDLTQIMQDYTEESVLKAFDHTTGTFYTATGLDQIAQFFADVFLMLSDLSELEAPIIKVVEATPKMHGYVYLIWSCPSSGVTSATDTFIFSPENKIISQRIAYASAILPTAHAEL